MNKLKVLGASALCGSLAAISAHAGEMTVKGSANATYTTKEKAVTGQPLGMTTGLTFTGSGELDNGNSFTVNIYHDDQNAWSSADISVDLAGIGKVTFDQAGGTGLGRRTTRSGSGRILVEPRRPLQSARVLALPAA